MRTNPRASAALATPQAVIAPGELSRLITRELRSPLAGIATTARLLRRALHTAATGPGGAVAVAAAEPAAPQADLWWCHSLDAILSEASRLERVVQSLLDLAQTRRPQLERVDVAQALGSVLRAVAATAAAAGVRVRVEAPETPLDVLVDPALIQHVFFQLASNAIQAMPRGGDLVLRARRPDAGSAFACIDFADTGCGIPPEDVPRVFQPFFTRRVDGLGLGLAAAAAQVEAQGGHITVESTPGVGSCFAVFVRCARHIATEPTLPAGHRSDERESQGVTPPTPRGGRQDGHAAEGG